ncbi:unnamed protein product [Tuber aestivum]|uniref:Uncharacterized protein n=1 Tax=Tuber aestivum TaxID=59557 RepID=A0A292Q728_9PEZI|nr:unnamed protein product [Tuber aestivum]
MATMMKMYSMVSANFQPKDQMAREWVEGSTVAGSDIRHVQKGVSGRMNLAVEIDEILKDIQQAQAAAKRKKVYLTSIASYGIGMPSPGRWVLVDLKDGSLVYQKYMESLVYPGAQYIVLCLGSTEIPRGILRPHSVGEGGFGEGGDEDESFEDVGENIDQVA